MAQILQGAEHGLYRILVQRVGSNGISYGTTGDTLAVGSVSNPFVMEKPQTAGVTLPDRTVVDFTGGDGWFANYMYGATSMAAFELTSEIFNGNLNEVITNAQVDQTTNDLWTEFTDDELAVNFPQVSLIIQYRVQSTEEATFGATKWVNLIYPRGWMAPKRNSVAFQAKSQRVYQFTPTSASRHINGHPFGTNLSATGNRCASYYLITDYPLYMATMVANGTTATITSPYKPVTSAVGTASSTRNQIVKYVTSTNTATIGVADTITVADGEAAVGTALTPASGNILTWLFEQEYAAAS